MNATDFLADTETDVAPNAAQFLEDAPSADDFLTDKPGVVSRQLRSVAEAPIRFERGIGEKIGDVASGAARVADMVSSGDAARAPVHAVDDFLVAHRARTRGELKVMRPWGQASTPSAAYLERRRAQDEAATIARQQRLETDSPLHQWGRDQVEFSRKVFGGSPDIDDTFISQLSVAAGGMLPDIALAAVPGAGPAAAASSYGLQAGEQQAQEAVAAGRPERADVAFVSAAGLGFASDRLLSVAPNFWKLAKESRLAGLAPKKFGEAWASWAAKSPVKARILEGGLREGVQEGTEQAGQNYIASDVAGYDPERPITKDVGTSAVLGAALGGGAGGASAAFRPPDAKPQPPNTSRPLDDELPPAPPLSEVRIQTGTDDLGNPIFAEKVKPNAEEFLSTPEQSSSNPAIQQSTPAVPIETERQRMARESVEAMRALAAAKAAANNPPLSPAATTTPAQTPAAPQRAANTEPAASTPAAGESTSGQPDVQEKPAQTITGSNVQTGTEMPVQPQPASVGGRAAGAAIEVTESHLAQARQAVADLRGEERPPDILDEIEGQVTSGLIRVPEDMADVLDASRERIAGELHQKPWKRLSSAQRKAINQQLRLSTTEGMAADEALPGLGEKFAGMSVEDFANAILDAGESRLLERKKGDSKEVVQMAREIANAEAQTGTDETVMDWDQAAAVSQAESGLIRGSAAEKWADNVIAESGKRFNTGLDPELLVAYVVKGTALFESGVRELAAWSQAMAEQFGEGIRPHLQNIWNQATSRTWQAARTTVTKRATKALAGQPMDFSSYIEQGHGNGWNRRENMSNNASEALANGRVMESQFMDWLADRLDVPRAAITKKALSWANTKAQNIYVEYHHVGNAAVDFYEPATIEKSPRFWLGLAEGLTRPSHKAKARRAAMESWQSLREEMIKGGDLGNWSTSKLSEPETGYKPQPLPKEWMDRVKEGMPFSEAKQRAEAQRLAEEAARKQELQQRGIEAMMQLPELIATTRTQLTSAHPGMADKYANMKAGALPTALRNAGMAEEAVKLAQMLDAVRHARKANPAIAGGVAGIKTPLETQSQRPEGQADKPNVAAWQSEEGSALTDATSPESAPAVNDKIESALDRAIAASDPWQQQRKGELHLFGLPKFVTLTAKNGMLRVIRATWRGTKNLAQALQAGIEWLRSQNLPGYSETEIKTWLAANVTVTPGDDDINIREFSDQLEADQPLPPDPARMVANLLYDRRTNESDAAFAARVMQAVGGPQAAVDVFTDSTNGLPGSVRMFLGQLIIKAFGVAGQHEAAARFYDDTFAGHVTETAQALQSLNAFLALTPEGKLIWAQRKIKRAADNLIEPVEPQLNAVKKELDAANTAGIEATTAAPDLQDAARQAVDAALEKQAQTPGTELQEAIRKEVLDQLVKAGLLTEREAEIYRLHLEGTADNSTLAEKLQRAGIPLHDKRADAINQLYKAKTKAEREKIKSRARKARQQPKAPRQQRQPTQEDWIRKARSISSREIEAAAKKLRAALEPSATRRSPAIQEFYQRLTARLKTLLPEHPKAVKKPLTDAELIREVFTNPEKYAEVWAQLGTEIRDKYGIEGMADLTNTLGELSPEGLVRQTMETNIDRIIREQMLALRVQFGQIIRQHYTKQAATTADLKEKIVAAVGLSEADANNLAMIVQRRFAMLVTARKQKALEKLLKPVKRLARPQLAQRIIERSNMGALSQEQFWNLVRANLDLPAWNNELAERIRRQVDVIERIPEAQTERKQKAETDLLNIIERAKGIDFLDMGLAFYKTNLLTGITTTVKNVASTFQNVMQELPVQLLINPSVAPDMLIMAGEIIRDGSTKGVQGAVDNWQSGILTGSRIDKVQAGRVLEQTRFGERGGVPIRAEGRVTRWLAGGLRTVLESDPGLPYLGMWKPVTLTGNALKNLAEMRVIRFLNAWKFVTRGLGSQDMLFFKPAEETRAALLALRMARTEGLKGEAGRDRARQILGYGAKAVATARAQAEAEGFTGPEAARRTAEILNANRPLELREDARAFALRATFNSEPYGLFGFFAQLINKGKTHENPKTRLAFNLMFPFTDIIANVLNAQLNYTPVGALRVAFARRSIAGVKLANLTPDQQAEFKRELYVKALLGTTLLVGLGLKFAQYLDDEDPEFAIYGAGPENADDRKGLEAKKWIPHSFKVGNQYYSFGTSPLAIPLAMLGNYQDRLRDARVFKSRSAQRVADDLPLMIAGVVAEGALVITEQSFLTGMMQVNDILDANSAEQRGQAFLKLGIRTATSSVIPNAVRQVDRYFDPQVYEQRRSEGILVNNIPFVRGEKGQPALNNLGLPLTRPLFSTFASSQADVPPLVKMLAETGNWPHAPNRNEIYPRTGRTMTDAEYYDYVKGSGEIARPEVLDLTKHKRWPSLTAEQQAQMISEEFSRARQVWRYQHGW